MRVIEEVFHSRHALLETSEDEIKEKIALGQKRIAAWGRRDKRALWPEALYYVISQKVPVFRE